MMHIIPTQRPWHHRVADVARQLWQERQQRSRASAELRALDGRTLADIGIDASEIGSVDAEAHALAQHTRRRIVLVARHA